MQNEQLFRTEVFSTSDYDEIPAVVEFSIDITTAREILRLAALVKMHNLYKVEKFDWRARYLPHEVEGSPDRSDTCNDDDDTVRTEADRLNVSDTSFCFSAYLKHTDIEIRSEWLRIDDLVEHFNLMPDAEGAGSEAISSDTPAD